MAVYSGKDGKLHWADKSATRVRNWTLQSTLDTLEVTDLGADSRSYVHGLKSATGSATLIYHDDDSTLVSIIHNTITTGEPGHAILDLMWGSHKQIKMSAYITSVNITCSVGEVMTADISFQMTGDYRVANL